MVRAPGSAGRLVSLTPSVTETLVALDAVEIMQLWAAMVNDCTTKMRYRLTPVDEVIAIGTTFPLAVMSADGMPLTPPDRSAFSQQEESQAVLEPLAPIDEVCEASLPAEQLQEAPVIEVEESQEPDLGVTAESPAKSLRLG